ncbi:MAG TPA: GTP 3',8-cyclase MoaA [Thermodesulfobacteriota bacterium]|nr:GTP 3',8-cyclase MoaA [Thermodesulfobacteriota bacterium]
MSENSENGFSLKDSFGRTINNLRISVTDRCNFRCQYCMPENGMAWIKKGELVTFEEIERLVNIFSGLGIKKIRLTGGEPLMRRDLHLLVRMISNISGIEDLALTTNGYFLTDQAEKLAEAGLKRINVSLDSLDAVKFGVITRRDYYHQVWEGIEAVDALGIKPVKINVVLMRGVNDDEIPRFAYLARERSFVIRFIEFMPLGADDGWTPDKVVSTQEIIETIEEKTGKKLIPVEYRGSQPADRFMFEDGIGEIGFISSVSEPFCNHCNRVRLTSDGKLRTCLFSLKETDLKKLMREGAGDEAIKEIILKSVWNKEPGHLINRPGFIRPNRTMSQIGG